MKKEKNAKRVKNKKSVTVAGLCYGDFPSIGLMLLSGLYYRYFCLILCAPLVSLSYYDFG